MWKELIHELSLSFYGVILIPMIIFSVAFYIIAFSGIFIRNKETSRTRNTIKNWPKVTVQIPTLNELVALRCVKKCLNFDYPKDKLEIIIGDDSNKPEISEIITDFAKNHSQVKITRRGSNKGFKAGNLNYMLKQSSGDIIVIFDSDFLPPKKFLKKVIPPFVKDKKLGSVQTKWEYLNINQNKVSKFASSLLMVYHQLLASINSRNNVSLLFGSAQAIRKSALIKLGGWQEGSLTEDVEFSLKLLKDGYNTMYLKNFKTPGEVPFTIKGFFKQQKRWAFGNARAFLQHYRWILFGRKLSLFQKSSLTFTLIGYVSAPLLVLFTLAGMISFMTGNPADIDVVKFFGTTGWTIIINSGFMAATVMALIKEKRLRMILSVGAASITVGVIISLGVTLGFFKALLGRKVDWYMIQKKGNDTSLKKLSPSINKIKP